MRNIESAVTHDPDAEADFVTVCTMAETDVEAEGVRGVPVPSPVDDAERVFVEAVALMESDRLLE